MCHFFHNHDGCCLHALLRLFSLLRFSLHTRLLRRTCLSFCCFFSFSLEFPFVHYTLPVLDISASFIYIIYTYYTYPAKFLSFTFFSRWLSARPSVLLIELICEDKARGGRHIHSVDTFVANLLFSLNRGERSNNSARDVVLRFLKLFIFFFLFLF